MKCPKCGYVSFDYNLSCPKCNKDISSEQAKLHIPAFRPDPPFLLGALTGEANESQIGPAPAASQIPFEKEADISLDDLKINDTGELELGSDANASDDLDKLLDMDEIELDEIPLTGASQKSKFEARVVRATAPKKKAGATPADDELSLDLEDLDLDLELEDAKPH